MHMCVCVCVGGCDTELCVLNGISLPNIQVVKVIKCINNVNTIMLIAGKRQRHSATSVKIKQCMTRCLEG